MVGPPGRTRAAYASGVASKVAVAPDVADGSFVAVVIGATVVVSVDGGATWGAMAACDSETSRRSVAISVAPAIGGARSVAVAGDHRRSARPACSTSPPPPVSAGPRDGWMP